jgi:hypothetical protein
LKTTPATPSIDRSGWLNEAHAFCVLTTGTNSYRSGLDVVVEGSVERVTDNAALARLRSMWKDKIDWAFEVGDGGFLDTEAAGHPALIRPFGPRRHARRF